MSILKGIKEKLFRQNSQSSEELVIKEPEKQHEEEIVQSKETIDLFSQMQIIKVVSKYMDEFVFPRLTIQSGLDKGFELKNEIFVSNTDEPVYRCNMDVFFQDSSTGERKIKYLVSAVRFEGDEWRVFQVKEVLPIES